MDKNCGESLAGALLEGGWGMGILDSYCFKGRNNDGAIVPCFEKIRRKNSG